MHASGAVSYRVLICMPYGEMSGHQSCKSYTYAYSEIVWSSFYSESY